MRQPGNIHKSQTSHHSPHRHHHHNTHSTNRTLVPSQISPHHSAYLIPNHHHAPVDAISPQRQQQSHYSQQQKISPHNESIKNNKESISIQEFMNKSVNDFVSSTSKLS